MTETSELIDRLRAQNDRTGTESAALIEWFIDERETLLAARIPPAEYVVRPDTDAVGVLYTGAELVGWRVLVVPVAPVSEPWALKARGEA